MKQILPQLIALFVALIVLLSCVWAGCWFHYADLQEWIKLAGTITCTIIGFFSVISAVVIVSWEPHRMIF